MPSQKAEICGYAKCEHSSWKTKAYIEENGNFSQIRPLKAIPWKKMVKVKVLKYSTGYVSELESP